MSEMDMYRSLFIAESRENHETIVKNLLILERGSDESAIGEIFRAAHSLKGMSATMGFDQLERLCHAMEDVFQNIRSGQLTVQPDLVDTLLKASDDIEMILDDIESGGSGSDIHLEDRLNALLEWKVKGGNPVNVSPGQSGPQVPGPALLPGTGEKEAEYRGVSVEASGVTVPVSSAGEEEYKIAIRLKPDCDNRNLRGMIVLENLAGLGTIVETTPSKEVVEDGQFDGSLSLRIRSDAGIDALKAAVAGTDVMECRIGAELVYPVQMAVSPAASGDALRKESKPEVSGAGKEEKADKNREVKNIRVDIARLDQMMNLIEDLVINRGRLAQIAHKHRIKELDETLNMVGRSVSDLQNIMMNIRMIPLSHIFNRFPRAVRDLAKKEEKEVEFVIEGGDTEMDRSILDGLNDPLLHLIRNAVDHGIEIPETRIGQGKPAKGLLHLVASRDRENVVIVIEDDGGGINSARVKSKAIERGLITEEQGEDMSDEQVYDLLFLPGFSMAEKITDVSGRGVGLDVVRTAIDSLKGTIKVDSVLGKGTRFELVLPPTMAIVNVLMVRINSRRCAIPVNNVVEVAGLSISNIHHIGSQEAIMIRNEVLPLRRLEEMFGRSEICEIFLIVHYQNRKLAIPVDLIEGQQEVVIKPMSPMVGMCKGISGVTIPGDGEVVPVLDINSIIKEN
ncbi:MAG TPA: chemotaxis protein CheA [Methanoregulaceae archaeon]|nr:chemotaxis protein CheA [Methanoregulaceae archaeon]